MKTGLTQFIPMQNANEQDSSEFRSIVECFLREHFCVEDGVFAAKDENVALGNRRFNFAHYMIGNVEVAMLVGPNIRYQSVMDELDALLPKGHNLCFMEIFAPSFKVSTIVGLSEVHRRSVFSPLVSITEGYNFNFHRFDVDGNMKKAKAYFTFAKLTK